MSIKCDRATCLDRWIPHHEQFDFEWFMNLVFGLQTSGENKCNTLCILRVDSDSIREYKCYGLVGLFLQVVSPQSSGEFNYL